MNLPEGLILSGGRPRSSPPSYIHDNTYYCLDAGYDITNASLFALPNAGSGLFWWMWPLIGLGVVVAALGMRETLRRYNRSRRVNALRGSLGIQH